MQLRLSLLIGLALAASGCGDDGSKHGFRDDCASGSGAITGCEPDILASAEDLCWRLVECGSIPVAGPEDDDGILDWPACVGLVNGLDDYQYEYSLACVESATCDELKTNGSPNEPRRGTPPVCLRHGQQ